MEKQRNSWNLKQLPLPFAGVALAFATLGNILVDIPWLKTSCGIVSSIICVSVLLKCVLAMDQVKKDLTNPVVTASFATFPMAGMVLATYLIPLNSFFASLLWYVSLVGHLVLLTYWGIKFLAVARQKMLAVYFIPCVGFVVASITAPAFQNQLIGQILFYIGLIFYLSLLYPVMKANIQGDFPQMLQPLEMITAAPGSLCLAGYLTVFPKPNLILVVILSILAFVSTLWGYKAFIKLDQRPFFPTFAAATFPFVISALAMKKLNGYGTVQQWGITNIIYWIAIIELVIATLSCIYVLFRYIKFFTTMPIKETAVKEIN